MRRILVLIIIIFVILLAFYHKKTNNDGLLALKVNADKSALFQLYNDSENEIWLDIAEHNGSAQAGYAAKITAKHYSVFVLAGKNLDFACSQGPLGPNMRKIDCNKVITLVPLSCGKNIDFSGNYWLVENVDKVTLCSKLAQKGAKCA